jgi:hypothetical protein
VRDAETQGKNVSARTQHEPDLSELTPEQEAAAKAASSWVQQFARTLKTCRLYDSRDNQNVSRFRQELYQSLCRVIDEHGPLALRFTSDDVLSEGVSLYPARSRDDNLALAFYRDGVRTLTFSAGIEPAELDALLDAVIHMTGQSPGEDDLVTLLWQARLNRLEVDYVPGEADTSGAAPAEGAEPLPWPAAASQEPESPRGTAPAVAVEAQLEATGTAARSDDWSIGEGTIEIEAGFEELQALAPSEMERFRSELEAECRVSTVTASIAIANAYVAAGVGPEDRIELARFLPRVLRQAFVQGSWREAHESLLLLARCQSPEWSVETFAQELLQPISVSSMRDRLEQQEPAAVSDFIAFARGLGEPAVDLLNLVMPEIQNGRHQRLLADAIVEACRNNPERLSPALADPRWFVVRNIVQMLGAIGGNQIVGLLQSVAGHAEPRVRLEVVTALRRVEPRLARPLLIGMLEGADTRMFCSVLQGLSQVRDPVTARTLIEIMLAPAFEKRPVEEKRAVYSAVSLAGGDESLSDLEAELYRGNWLSRNQEPHRQAVARCLARIGTPASRAALERGARSRRAPVRKVCEEALARLSPHE